MSDDCKPLDHAPPTLAIRVVPAARAQHDVLSRLMQLYAYYFSEISGLELEDDGRFVAPSLDVYWEESSRFPFFIGVGATLAGFALVNKKSRLSGADDVWDMAEFFVLRKHRRAGVGLEAARQLFASRSVRARPVHGSHPRRRALARARAELHVRKKSADPVDPALARSSPDRTPTGGEP